MITLWPAGADRWRRGARVMVSANAVHVSSGSGSGHLPQERIVIAAIRRASGSAPESCGSWSGADDHRALVCRLNRVVGLGEELRVVLSADLPVGPFAI